MALFMLGVVGFEPLSLAIGGVLGATIGGRGILLACGIMVAIAGILATTSGAFRDAK